jgi:hypothetical protein
MHLTSPPHPQVFSLIHNTQLVPLFSMHACSARSTLAMHLPRTLNPKPSHPQVFSLIHNTLRNSFPAQVVPYSQHIPSFCDIWGYNMAFTDASAKVRTAFTVLWCGTLINYIRSPY